MVERSNRPAAIPVSPLAPSPQVTISDDNSRVIATLPAGDRIEVLFYGATVISWKSANGKENLFISEAAKTDGSKPVRGGIPLVFPLFGASDKSHETGKLPQHGFARNTRWEYLGKTSSESTGDRAVDSSVKLDFGLSDSMLPEASRSAWNHKFNLTYSITLSTEELNTTMVVRNVESTAWDFKILFHTYLQISDISAVSIKGLESIPFTDKVKGGQAAATKSEIAFREETDRVYTNVDSPVVSVLEKGKKRFEITRDSLGDIVVWNPWLEKAKGMGDFEPKEGYKNMVCVEAGSVDDWLTLEGGDTWEGGQSIKAL
ncbi:MAG: hypothetical protein MMC33_004796 [Icmadophila ericetorum]|nr:hypothetical protein [Icmadophila ericetorum]